MSSRTGLRDAGSIDTGHYTSRGYCGVLDGGQVANDATLELLARQAVAHAQAGADIVAPSDMMDERVGAVRAALDAAGRQDIPILAYVVLFLPGTTCAWGRFRARPQQGHSSLATRDRDRLGMRAQRGGHARTGAGADHKELKAAEEHQ
jgi:delta-aminolevulinic acid dehydratase/porphobilinogen synthase